MSTKLYNDTFKEEEIVEMTIEEFDAIEGNHVFSEEYNKKKTAMLNSLKPEDKKQLSKRRYRVAVAAVLVLIILPITAFAASKLYQTRISKNKHETKIAITKDSGATEEKNTTEAKSTTEASSSESSDTAIDGSDRMLKCTLNYLPEGCAKNEWDEYKFGGGENHSELGISLFMYDMSRGDEFNASIYNSEDVKTFTANGHEGIIVEKDETFAYNKEVYVLFEEEEICLFLFVEYGISAEEIEKIVAAAEIEETTDAALAAPIYFWEEEESLAEEDEEPIIYETDCVKVGDTIKSDYIAKMDMTVMDVKLVDSIKEYPENELLIENLEPFIDGNKKLTTYKRTEQIEGDGINETGSFGKTEEIQKTFVELTIKVKNQNESECDEFCVGNAYIDFFEPNGDGTMRDIPFSYVIDNTPQRYAIYDELVYFDKSKTESKDKQFYYMKELKKDEEVICHIGFIIDEDMLQNAYMGYPVDNYGGYKYFKLFED